MKKQSNAELLFLLPGRRKEGKQKAVPDAIPDQALNKPQNTEKKWDPYILIPNSKREGAREEAFLTETRERTETPIAIQACLCHFTESSNVKNWKYDYVIPILPHRAFFEINPLSLGSITTLLRLKDRPQNLTPLWFHLSLNSLWAGTRNHISHLWERSPEHPMGKPRTNPNDLIGHPSFPGRNCQFLPYPTAPYPPPTHPGGGQTTSGETPLFITVSSKHLNKCLHPILPRDSLGKCNSKEPDRLGREEGCQSTVNVNQTRISAK